jgi:hypothetical protein
MSLGIFYLPFWYLQTLEPKYRMSHKSNIIELIYRFIFLQIMMYMSKEERIEIILFTGNRNQREAAAKFNRYTQRKLGMLNICVSALLRHVTPLLLASLNLCLLTGQNG